jgi:hypothetical protein
MVADDDAIASERAGEYGEKGGRRKRGRNERRWMKHEVIEPSATYSGQQKALENVGAVK